MADGAGHAPPCGADNDGGRGRGRGGGRNALHGAWVRAWGNEWHEPEFGARGAEELRRQQLRSVFSLTQAMMLGNLILAPLLTIVVLGHGRAADLAAISWCFALCGVSFAMIVRARARHLRAESRRIERMDSAVRAGGLKPSRSKRGTAGAVRTLVWTSAMLSALWCVPLIAFYGLTDGSARGVMGAAMIGILSAGGVSLSRVQHAAKAWLLVAGLIHAAVAFTAGLGSGELGDFILAAFAVVAATGLWLGVSERAASATHSFRQARRLAEKNGIIDLLLKEYEGAGTEWVWEIDARGMVKRAPSQVLAMLGLDENGVRSVPLVDLVRMQRLPEGEKARAALMAAIVARREFSDTVLPITDRRDGTVRWIMTRGHPIFEDGEFAGWRGICADATRQVNRDAEIRFLAEHDALTGLENRPRLRARMQGWQASGRPFGGMLIDLDRFKLVNDTMGHAAGDDLLKQVADRLKEAATLAGATDGASLTIARYGGDEFALGLAEERRSGARAEATTEPLEDVMAEIAQRIVETLGRPFTVEGRDVHIGASVGYALAPVDASDVATLGKLADLALYRAKHAGRGQACRFDPALDEAPGDARALEADLREACARGELRLAFQPIVETGESGQRLAGREALLRWTHPERGAIGPDEFIPIAEASGAIVPIGEWVLREACGAAANWSEAVPVSVNVSARQLQDPGFVTRVLSALAHTGLPAERLEIEITESALVSDAEGVIGVIAQLRGVGVRVSLDDFGTGYSSLAYLADFNLDRIKIDRSFVAGMDGSKPHARAIIRAVAGLAREMGLETVGEGVETPEQAAILEASGCRLQQGWLHGRPEIEAPTNDVSLNDASLNDTPLNDASRDATQCSRATASRSSEFRSRPGQVHAA